VVRRNRPAPAAAFVSLTKALPAPVARTDDAISIYFADATLASAFAARWCARSEVETAGGVFHVRQDDPAPWLGRGCTKRRRITGRFRLARPNLASADHSKGGGFGRGFVFAGLAAGIAHRTGARWRQPVGADPEGPALVDEGALCRDLPDHARAVDIGAIASPRDAAASGLHEQTLGSLGPDRRYVLAAARAASTCAANNDGSRAGSPRAMPHSVATPSTRACRRAAAIRAASPVASS
jgi:hypothetical protein